MARQLKNKESNMNLCVERNHGVSLTAILYHSRAAATLGYMAFVALFVAEIYIASTHWTALQSWQILLLGLAAFRGGVALSENGVFAWLREPFCVTEPDCKAAGDCVNPRYKSGVMGVIGACLACPICTATHVAGALLTLCALFPAFGILLVYGLAAAGMAEMLYFGRETLEWTGRKARESCKR